MRDRLAEEMDRRAEASPAPHYSEEVSKAVKALEDHCYRVGSYQQFRHSTVYLCGSHVALVRWD